VPYLLGLGASGCLVAAGVLSVIGASRTVDLAGLLGVGRTTVRLDGLAGLFLTLVGGLGMAISAVFVSWVRAEGRVRGHGLGAGYLLLVGSVAVILVAGDAFLFLFGWEALTVSFYVLASYTRRSSAQASASWATLGFGKSSGAFLLLGFLLLAGSSGSFTIAAWRGVGPGALHTAAYALVVAGFAAKAGLAPFQVWMPVGYPAAAGPARAAMAGLAVNVGFYGLWRFLGVLGPPPLWLVVVVLVAGGLTALGGIVFAGVQSNLNRVIAYSSVENAGIIITAYGVALAGATVGRAELVAVGLLAATLQAIAHGVAKSGLFLSAANIEAHSGDAELANLAGSGRSHPWSGATFALGALTLAGLPPTIGFVSAWFVLEALMQQFRLHELALRLAMAGAGALVALSAGVAALTFVRLLAFTILGRPSGRSPSREHGALGRIGLVALGGSCLGLAAAGPYLIRFVARGLTPIVPVSVTRQALKSPWVLQPVFHEFSILSPSWLFVAMPVLLIVVVAATIGFSRGRFLHVRRVPAWQSATGGVAGPSSYTPFGYANPLRHVLANVLGTRRELQVVELPEPGPDHGHGHVEYQTTVIEPVESYIYRPVRRVLLASSRLAKRLQSGRLAAYIAYMLFALVAVLAVAAALR
jgi:formate hydrogenlyase subunit 3/multisubunit Na+/H+ antiporter MnhD subunit